MISRSVLALVVATTVVAVGCERHERSGSPSGGPDAAAKAAPPETEAQWGADEATLRRLFDALSEGVYGFRTAPQFGDMSPRKYVDAYYDTPAGALAAGSQAFRHRQRFTPVAPVSIVEGVDALEAQVWTPASDSIQYKGAPLRSGVTVERAKRGGAKLTHAQALDALGCRSSPFSPDDDPFAMLRADHPGAGCGDLVVRDRTVQYRMHFILYTTDPKKPLYHVSLDRVGALGPDGRPSGPMGIVVELEATRAWLAAGGAAALSAYEQLARALEADFALKPLPESKRALARAASGS